MKILYVFFIGLGLIVNAIINYYFLKKNELKIKDNVSIVSLQLVTIVLGSKILDRIINYKFYIYYDLYESLRVGYMFYGGLILSIITIIIYCKNKSLNINQTLKIVIPNYLLLYSICKMGCFFNKCCIGIHGFPIQLAECIICFVTYFIVMRNIKEDDRIYTSCILFGILRMISFFLKANIDKDNLITNEVISGLIVMSGIILFMIHKKKDMNRNIIKKST